MRRPFVLMLCFVLVAFMHRCALAATSLPAFLDTCPSAPILPFSASAQSTVQRIHNENELQHAIKNLKPHTTLLLSPGTY
ncbi:MAG: hypothetical protein P8176_14420, partial [Gammaproteobacteria bacterium]